MSARSLASGEFLCLLCSFTEEIQRMSQAPYRMCHSLFLSGWSLYCHILWFSSRTLNCWESCTWLLWERLLSHCLNFYFYYTSTFTTRWRSQCVFGMSVHQSMNRSKILVSTIAQERAFECFVCPNRVRVTARSNVWGFSSIASFLNEIQYILRVFQAYRLLTRQTRHFGGRGKFYLFLLSSLCAHMKERKKKHLWHPHCNYNHANFASVLLWPKTTSSSVFPNWLQGRYNPIGLHVKHTPGVEEKNGKCGSIQRKKGK